MKGQAYVDISMPGYIENALERLQHPAPSHPQFAPHRWTTPSYGSKVQLAPIDTTPLLDAKGKKCVQSVTGTLAYYSRGVDPTMQPAINEIAAKQVNPTEATLDACKMLLDYAHTYPNAKIRFMASSMRLTLDTDAADLVQPNARSRYAGYFYLTDNSPSPLHPMEPSLSSVALSAVLCDLQPRQNVPVSSTIVKKPLSYAISWTLSDTLKLQLVSKPTTPLR